MYPFSRYKEQGTPRINFKLISIVPVRMIWSVSWNDLYLPYFDSGKKQFKKYNQTSGSMMEPWKFNDCTPNYDARLMSIEQGMLGSHMTSSIIGASNA